MQLYHGYHPTQHGDGLGNILGALFRAARPIIRTGLRTALPIAAKFGSNVLNDLAEGENVLQSAKRHGKRAGLDVASALLKRAAQGGNGQMQPLVPRIKSRKRHIRERKASKKVKRQRRTVTRLKRSRSPIDIFSNGY